MRIGKLWSLAACCSFSACHMGAYRADHGVALCIGDAHLAALFLCGYWVSVCADCVWRGVGEHAAGGVYPGTSKNVPLPAWCRGDVCDLRRAYRQKS